jgi:hypothetical protein
VASIGFVDAIHPWSSLALARGLCRCSRAASVLVRAQDGVHIAAESRLCQFAEQCFGLPSTALDSGFLFVGGSTWLAGGMFRVLHRHCGLCQHRIAQHRVVPHRVAQYRIVASYRLPASHRELPSV